MATKYREGDIVSVEGKVDMVYLSDDKTAEAAERERVVIRLKGHYGTVTIGALHVTLVRPNIEAGMSVWDANIEESFEVLHVLDDQYIVGKRLGLAGGVPVVLRTSGLEVLEAPGHDPVDLREEPGMVEDLHRKAYDPDVPPPAPPGADDELVAMHARAREWPGQEYGLPDPLTAPPVAPELADLEPPLGPTTVDEGYPKHPREDFDVAKLVKDTAQVVTQTYVRRLADGSYATDHHVTDDRRPLDSF